MRISDEIELLDAPGVIPWKLDNQENAVKLAICEDIGQASYDNQLIAAAAVEFLVELDFGKILESRYHLDPHSMTGEAYIYQLGDRLHQGDKERVARQILYDFRTGNMGAIPLELPPLLK